MTRLLFFRKTFRQIGHICFDKSAERERRNNAAPLNLLKLNSFGICLLLGSICAVYVAGTTQLFLVIVSETFFGHLKSRLSKNSLHFCWFTSGIKLTKARSFSLYAMPDTTLINESSKNGFTGSNLPAMVV